MSSVHPKTAGAGAGAGAGLILTALLRAVGVDITPDLAAALAAVLSVLVAYLAPSPPAPPIAAQAPDVAPRGLDFTQTRMEIQPPGEHWS